MRQIENKHTIRLHGPWSATPVVSTDQEPSKISVQQDWESVFGNSFAGTVRYKRKFNRPTGLLPNQSVKVVVTNVDFYAECFLNDQRLGDLTFGEPAAFEVGATLKDFNRLIIDVRLSEADKSNPARSERFAAAGGVIGSVYLEIAD